MPEVDPHFIHTLEGTGDMPSHIKMALAYTSESVPTVDGWLLLGTWQSVLLWEQCRTLQVRRVVVTVLG